TFEQERPDLSNVPQSKSIERDDTGDEALVPSMGISLFTDNMPSPFGTSSQSKDDPSLNPRDIHDHSHHGGDEEGTNSGERETGKIGKDMALLMNDGNIVQLASIQSPIALSSNFPASQVSTSVSLESTTPDFGDMSRYRSSDQPIPNDESFLMEVGRRAERRGEMIEGERRSRGHSDSSARHRPEKLSVPKAGALLGRRKRSLQEEFGVLSPSSPLFYDKSGDNDNIGISLLSQLLLDQTPIMPPPPPPPTEGLFGTDISANDLKPNPLRSFLSQEQKTPLMSPMSVESETQSSRGEMDDSLTHMPDSKRAMSSFDAESHGTDIDHSDDDIGDEEIRLIDMATPLSSLSKPSLLTFQQQARNALLEQTKKAQRAKCVACLHAGVGVCVRRTNISALKDAWLSIAKSEKKGMSSVAASCVATAEGMSPMLSPSLSRREKKRLEKERKEKEKKEKEKRKKESRFANEGSGFSQEGQKYGKEMLSLAELLPPATTYIDPVFNLKLSSTSTQLRLTHPDFSISFQIPSLSDVRRVGVTTIDIFLRDGGYVQFSIVQPKGYFTQDVVAEGMCASVIDGLRVVRGEEIAEEESCAAVWLIVSQAMQNTGISEGDSSSSAPLLMVENKLAKMLKDRIIKKV
ncbi:hypothetical protein ADUPG1_005949, partial [Aduncisulcus paluster]